MDPVELAKLEPKMKHHACTEHINTVSDDFSLLLKCQTSEFLLQSWTEQPYLFIWTLYVPKLTIFILKVVSFFAIREARKMAVQGELKPKVIHSFNSILFHSRLHTSNGSQPKLG